MHQLKRLGCAHEEQTHADRQRGTNSEGRRDVECLHPQALDTSTPAGKAMFQVRGVFAEFERTMIVARVNAGLKRARAAGSYVVSRYPLCEAKRKRPTDNTQSRPHRRDVGHIPT